MNGGKGGDLEKATAWTEYLVNMRAETVWGDLLCVYALELAYIDREAEGAAP